MQKSELRGRMECLQIQNTRLLAELDVARPKMNRVTELEKANESQAKLIVMLNQRNLELEDIVSRITNQRIHENGHT